MHFRGFLKLSYDLEDLRFEEQIKINQVFILKLVEMNFKVKMILINEYNQL